MTAILTATTDNTTVQYGRSGPPGRCQVFSAALETRSAYARESERERASTYQSVVTAVPWSRRHADGHQARCSKIAVEERRRGDGGVQVPGFQG
jgi:hypothetical protein